MKTDVLPLTIAISSRALFDLDESHRIFETQGIEAYQQWQIAHENEPLRPGMAFPLVKKLLALNDAAHQRVEVILVSRNSADTGLRIFNTIEQMQLPISRAAFTNGESPERYIPAFGVDLFLSAHAEDVRQVLQAGHAAATILPGHPGGVDDSQVRIAFDGDAVLFSDASERIYKEQGLDAFLRHEARDAESPMQPGPFFRVLQALHAIQQAYPADNNPIRTALVTARSAPAHKRVILTLREWGVRIDESLFLGGREKGPVLAAFGADIFFDDQQVHCESASGHVPTGHVPHGVAND